MTDLLTLDQLDRLTAYYEALGPIIGFFLPFIEAFLPFLPLVVFVVANASAYGLLWGFLLTWTATVAGSYCVFLLVRAFRDTHFVRRITEKRFHKLIHWVNTNGLSPLFVLICLPFTPSVLVNIVAGISNIKKINYFIVLFAGKCAMILFISYIGYDLRELLTSPTKLILSIVAIVAMWAVGKFFERRLNKRVERDFEHIKQQKKHTHERE